MTTKMPDLLRNRLEDARDTATSNIEFLRDRNEKAEAKIAALRDAIEQSEQEIADNEAAHAEATRLLAGTPSEDTE